HRGARTRGARIGMGADGARCTHCRSRCGSGRRRCRRERLGGQVDVLCLDLEGVLIPEIWQAVADRTGIEELRTTTRDIPVYDELMRMRLGVLEANDLPLSLVQEVIEGLEPLAGA